MKTLKQVKECIANQLEKNKELYPDMVWATQAGYLEGFLLSYVDEAEWQIKHLKEKIEILEQYKKIALEHAKENDND